MTAKFSTPFYLFVDARVPTSMQVETLQKFFSSSPAVRLLRSPHAFWIVDFLYQQFKTAGRITCPHSRLAFELDNYLDSLAEGKIWGDNSREKADTYLGNWCSGSVGWLKRFIDEQADEPSYQLTAEFEKALSFVENALRSPEFVGTESRLRAIIDILSGVVTGIAEDPTQRIEQLEKQKTEIEAQLRRLRADPNATKLSATQVRERFWMATQQLQQLKSEFRAVEDRFKEITRGVQKKVLAAAETRGDILQFALDSEDMLKQDGQGQSFFEFLKLIHSPDSQEHINALVDELAHIEELAGEQQELESLRRMVPTLIAEAEKILRTTQQLSVTLRRLLDSRSTRHHQQLASVLRDILNSAAEQAESPPSDIGLEVEVEIEIQAPMERPFWSATDPFEEVELAPTEIDPETQQDVLAQLVKLERLDWPAMRRNITQATEEDEVALDEFLERYPVSAGAIEVLGYLQIAFDDGHRIDRSHLTLLDARKSGKLTRSLQIPSVVFVPRSGRAKQPQLVDNA